MRVQPVLLVRSEALVDLITYVAQRARDGSVVIVLPPGWEPGDVKFEEQRFERGIRLAIDGPLPEEAATT